MNHKALSISHGEVLSHKNPIAIYYRAVVCRSIPIYDPYLCCELSGELSVYPYLCCELSGELSVYPYLCCELSGELSV